MYLEEKKVGEETVVYDEAGKLLLAAADYIEEHGWCQNHFSNFAGNVCARGALNRVRYSHYDGYMTAILRLNDYTKPVGGIYRWNDKVCHTKEEVIAGLRECATQGR